MARCNASLENGMLSWFAITYNTARLGLEAQNAAAFRLMRLAGGASKTAPDSPEEIALPEDPPAAIAIAPKRRYAVEKIHKKSAPVRKRGNRAT